MPRRLRPQGSSRFRLTSVRLPTRPPYSPQGRRCCCRCCYCFPDSLPPTLPQPPPPPPPEPEPRHDRRPRRHHAPPSAHT
ncbi:protein naked cuticle homolog 2-like [Mastomys coucha]|uniref:protein naked cuticle homolog 2-like n=1 Tax=Mastomys coucha TaxID=35658 RepID=UPI001262540A|nr:protein naked cuticle homolog 2-like [Mastomys coucha]